jgi:hypothetical protein
MILSRNIMFVAIVLISSSVYAQESTNLDGPKGRFQDDLISKLEGTWHLTRQIRGKEVGNSVSATWVLNHQFLQVHMKDVKNPPAYEAIALIGYIHSSKQYVAHWVDTYGGKFSAIGTGVRSGNSIEFRFAYPDGPFFNTFTWLPEKNQWVMRLESQDPTGARTLFAHDTLDRTK